MQSTLPGNRANHDWCKVSPHGEGNGTPGAGNDLNEHDPAKHFASDLNIEFKPKNTEFKPNEDEIDGPQHHQQRGGMSQITPNLSGGGWPT